jgi:hypothetical protein
MISDVLLACFLVILWFYLCIGIGWLVVWWSEKRLAKKRDDDRRGGKGGTPTCP